MSAYIEIELFHDWHDCTIDDAKTIGALMGFDIDKIYFSGFSSQGDGACFTGDFEYRKGAARLVREYAPQDLELHAIADAWAAAQKPLFYSGAGSIEHSGRYYHELSTRFSLEGRDGRDLSESEEESLEEIARDFMRWIYRRLESEYEYQCAWEAARIWQEAQEGCDAERLAARELVADLRGAIRDGITASNRICSELRGAIRHHLEGAQESLERRNQIESQFGYWQDGKQIPIAEFAAEYC